MYTGLFNLKKSAFNNCSNSKTKIVTRLFMRGLDTDYWNKEYILSCNETSFTVSGTFSSVWMGFLYLGEWEGHTACFDCNSWPSLAESQTISCAVGSYESASVQPLHSVYGQCQSLWTDSNCKACWILGTNANLYEHQQHKCLVTKKNYNI